MNIYLQAFKALESWWALEALQSLQQLKTKALIFQQTMKISDERSPKKWVDQ